LETKKGLSRKMDKIIEEENKHNISDCCGEKAAEEKVKTDGRRFNRPKSAGNSSFRKHNKLRFMKTERLRELNK
jgi:hypothetical protein